jgi:hypothetical protein
VAAINSTSSITSQTVLSERFSSQSAASQAQAKLSNGCSTLSDIYWNNGLGGKHVCIGLRLHRRLLCQSRDMPIYHVITCLYGSTGQVVTSHAAFKGEGAIITNENMTDTYSWVKEVDRTKNSLAFDTRRLHALQHVLLLSTF